MIQNILGYLERSQAAFPEKPAFSNPDSSLTYRQLYVGSRQIGSYLAAFTKTRQPVAVMAEKSPEVIAAFMGIVTAGCFYVFLDPAQPPARLNRILKSLEPAVFICDDQGKAVVPQLELTCQTLELDFLVNGELPAINDQVLSQIRTRSLDIDPLYAIFTSGSTGEPKGVVVSHRSVIDFIEHFTDVFSISHEDILGNQAPLDFDVSVKDIYSALKTGATVEMIPRKLFSMPMALLDFLCDRHVTTAIWAVSALCMVTSLNGFSYRIPVELKKVLFSGEVMPVRHLNLWRQHLPDTLFVNLYGPTEITCNCTYYIVDRAFQPGDSLPIGIPFPNEGVFLLDEHDQVISDPHVQGELCVSGSGLALGYYRNPEKTAQVFVQNPCNSSYPQLIYRTGDLAHYDEDGQLYFDSRKDFQIKHMGHRIELGEIETHLQAAPGIDRAACLFLEEKQKILAFYTGDVTKKEIISHLETCLPSYMHPNRYHQLDRMPLTKNGKIDRAALKELL